MKKIICNTGSMYFPKSQLSVTQFLLKAWKVKVSQSCLTLGDSMDYTIHGILQVTILE